MTWEDTINATVNVIAVARQMAEYIRASHPNASILREADEALATWDRQMNKPFDGDQPHEGHEL